MPFVPAAFANNTPMDWTAVAAQFTDFRTWVNAIPLGDVNAGGIRRSNFVRPIVAGFPLNGVKSTFQQAYHFAYGIGEPTALLCNEWGGRKRRLALVPYVNNGVTEEWHTPISRTIRVARNSDVEAHVSLEWQVRGTQPTAGGACYPDNGISGLAARGGFWALHYYSRQLATDDFQTAGVQHVYPMQPATDLPSGPVHDHGMACLVVTLAAGTWDIGLVYHRSAAPDTLDQIDVSRASLQIEVL